MTWPRKKGHQNRIPSRKSRSKQDMGHCYICQWAQWQWVAVVRAEWYTCEQWGSWSDSAVCVIFKLLWCGWGKNTNVLMFKMRIITVWYSWNSHRIWSCLRQIYVTSVRPLSWLEPAWYRWNYHNESTTPRTSCKEMNRLLRCNSE